jgi:hypothetical protein
MILFHGVVAIPPLAVRRSKEEKPGAVTKKPLRASGQQRQESMH